MKSSNDTNICYVFSQPTIDLALNEWVEQKSKNNPKETDFFLIIQTSMPWFLKHFNQHSDIFMFSNADLLEQLHSWREKQIAGYPHQQKLIESTCDGILDFFQSDIVNEHKMTVIA